MVVVVDQSGQHRVRGGPNDPIIIHTMTVWTVYSEDELTYGIRAGGG